MTPEEKARRDGFADALRSIRGGVAPDSLGDAGRRAAEAHSRNVNRLMGAARRGDRNAPVELARILYADELTR